MYSEYGILNTLLLEIANKIMVYVIIFDLSILLLNKHSNYFHMCTHIIPIYFRFKG